MANHWETLGFPVKTEKDIENLMYQAYKQMQQSPEDKTSYPGELYNYDCLSLGGGVIEIWMQQNKDDGYYVMAHPHLRGRSAIPVRLREAFDAGLGDIAFLVDVNPKGEPSDLKPIFAPDNANSLEIPNCSFQAIIAPPYAQHVIQKVNQDDRATVQITAFAEKIEVFKDEQSYIASQTPIDMGKRARGLMGSLLAFKHKMNKPVYMGSQYFMATDLANGFEGAPEPRAWMAAVVDNVVYGQNPLTHQPIYIVLARTVDDIPIDVTIAGSQIDGVEPGNIITGTFWLSARFIFED